MSTGRLAVLIPAAPGEDAADCLASVLAHTGPGRRVVVVDDGALVAEQLRAAGLDDEEVEIIPAPSGAPGNRGGLWVKLAAGLRRIARDPEVDLVLRMDTDALVIGPGIEDAARAAFAADPDAGMLGAARVGPDGRERDPGPAARLLHHEAGPAGLRDPRRRRTLRRIWKEARAHGYVDGEHALGGANLMRGSLVRTLAARGWLDLPELAGSGLSEDHLFGLMTVATGARIGEFGGPGRPLAVQWRGLPDHPDALLARGALVCHSVRAWDGLDEPAIRGIFRAARTARRDGVPSTRGGPAPTP